MLLIYLFTNLVSHFPFTDMHSIVCAKGSLSNNRQRPQKTPSDFEDSKIVFMMSLSALSHYSRPELIRQ